MDRATSPQESLLAASRALLAVADAAVDDLGLRAEDLGWLCSSLLPPNLELIAGADTGRPPRTLLREAEEELRRFPIVAYPAGTIDLVLGLCDLLRETAESSR
jgi:hypothetical protein